MLSILKNHGLNARVESATTVRAPSRAGAVSSADSPEPTTKKVILLYLDFGSGHISAAKSIKAEILKKDPNTQVILKNMSDFNHPIKNWIDQKAYWLLVNQFPEKFTQLYQQEMLEGKYQKDFSKRSRGYDNEVIRKYLSVEAADTVIATYFGAAMALSSLRSEGKLDPKTRLGWMHTDYFNGYLTRIPGGLDQSFVPHVDIKTEWVSNYGISESKVVATGMPINPIFSKPFANDQERATFLTQKGLDDSTCMITLASGGDGIGDFPLMIKSMAEAFNKAAKPLQIVAITGRNSNHKNALESQAFTKALPNGIKLKVEGFICLEDIARYMACSEINVNKSGGLSPIECFAANKPVVLLDVYGGHERDNAEFFEKRQLAVINRDQTNLGDDVLKLMNNAALKGKMLSAQNTMVNQIDVGAIADFALATSPVVAPPASSPHPLGYYNGRRNSDNSLSIRRGRHLAVEGAQQMSRLDQNSPIDLEIFLSYAAKPRSHMMSQNPFGHLALRVGDTVYTIDVNSTPNEDNEFFAAIKPEQYLWGMDPEISNPIPRRFVDVFGNNYGKELLSIRIAGISNESKNKIKAEIEKINTEFNAKRISYNATTANCVDYVMRALHEVVPLNHRPISMPIDTFRDYLSYFQKKRSDLRVEIVHYDQVRGAKPVLVETEEVYGPSHFPVSAFQPIETCKRLTYNTKEAPEEKLITARITSYYGPHPLQYEDPCPETNWPRTLDVYLAHLDAVKALKLQMKQRTRRSRVGSPAASGLTTIKLRLAVEDTLAKTTLGVMNLRGHVDPRVAEAIFKTDLKGLKAIAEDFKQACELGEIQKRNDIFRHFIVKSKELTTKVNQCLNLASQGDSTVAIINQLTPLALVACDDIETKITQLFGFNQGVWIQHTSVLATQLKPEIQDLQFG